LFHAREKPLKKLLSSCEEKPLFIQSKKEVQDIIVYFGAFNPVHRNHLSLMQKARKMIADEHALGFYCPAPDAYVKTKSLFFFDLQTRIQLLRSKITCSLDQIAPYVLDHHTTLLLIEKQFRSSLPISISVVLGSDTLNKALNMIPSSYRLLVVQRNEFPCPGPTGPTGPIKEQQLLQRRNILFWKEEEELTLSSSWVRQVMLLTSLTYELVNLITQML
jgi:nicotinic acid mononucleotide adenylyltransferase